MQVEGYVDDFRPPNTFIGWAAAPGHSVRDGLVVVVLLDGEVVGQAERTISRPDILGKGDGPFGYLVVTSVPITARQLWQGRVSVELRDGLLRGALQMQKHVDYAAAIDAVTALTQLMALPEIRLQPLFERLKTDPVIDPEFREQAMACLELLDQNRGTRLRKELTSSFEKRTLPNINAPSESEFSVIEIMGLYESMGENCEFGFVQRHFGYEPISLLRWANTPLEYLKAALAANFEGVGDPEHTEFTQIWKNEYGTRDKRYNMTAHTFIAPAQVTDFDHEFKRQCKRLSFMRRMLIENLRENSKIFVFFSYETLTDSDCRSLSEELRRFGPLRLLCVRADPALEGQVFQLGEGLFVGYIHNFSRWEAVEKHINFKSWLLMLKAAQNSFAKLVAI